MAPAHFLIGRRPDTHTLGGHHGGHHTLTRCSTDCYKKRDFENAMKHYQTALELDPDDITYLNNIAGEPSTADTPRCSRAR